MPQPQSSALFARHGAVGLVSNHIPIQVRYIKRRKENLVVTAVGKSFHTYGCQNLRLLSISEPHPGDIDCLAADVYFIFTACKNVIRSWKRGMEIKHTYQCEKNVRFLLPFGTVLISVEEDGAFKVWDIFSEELYLAIVFNDKSFKITSMVHLPAYLDKVLLGSEQGKMQLWNIKTSHRVKTFNGWGSAITCLEQAPALDVVAIGLASGRIIVHNLELNVVIRDFTQDWGPVLGISFRTPNDEHPIMASASTAGHIALWDLEKNELQSQIRDAHRGPVTGLQFLPNQPILVTSSPDNSLKMWLFDQPDGSGRLLKFREGHREPPSKIRFHGSNGENILSAGQDSTLRSFSTVGDILNKNLGQASFNRKVAKRKGIRNDPCKLPAIVDFTSETTREKEWDNIAACHRHLGLVTTWSYHKCRMGEHKLLNDRFKTNPLLKKATATCVNLSMCGNFTLIGYDSGHIDKYNIQSGIFRGSYGLPTAHAGSVQGIATDSLNHSTISGGGDCFLKFWKFKSLELIHCVEFETGISKLLLHRESNLLAVVMDDFTIQMVDIDTHNIIRLFGGHTNMITDIAFSFDSRWLISSSMDCTIRTWDIPSAHLIDCFLVDAACTSLTMSPTGDYLATTHVDNLGIYLWSNFTIYSHVTITPLPDDYEPEVMDLPTPGKDNYVPDEVMDEDIVSGQISEYKTPPQISTDLVTLSGLPRSRWKNLLELDIIKKRNQPKQPPKAPKAAPFFLPTVPGLEFKFAIEDLSSKGNKHENNSRLLIGGSQSYTGFMNMLNKQEELKDFEEAIQVLMSKGPSQLDVDLRLLSPGEGGSALLMIKFLNLISWLLSSNRNFEVAQAYLGVFLEHHWSTITSEELLLEYLDRTKDNWDSSWQRLDKLFNSSFSQLRYLKNVAL